MFATTGGRKQGELSGCGLGLSRSEREPKILHILEEPQNLQTATGGSKRLYEMTLDNNKVTICCIHEPRCLQTAVPFPQRCCREQTTPVRQRHSVKTPKTPRPPDTDTPETHTKNSIFRNVHNGTLLRCYCYYNNTIIHLQTEAVVLVGAQRAVAAFLTGI